MTETTRDLLIELGTEELPPKALPTLSAAFRDEIVKGLAEAGLSHGKVRAYATPRRLALVIEALQTRQADRTIERKGPALAAAFKDGQPTPAALGFARSCGVDVSQLQELVTKDGAWLVYRGEQPGQAAASLLPGILQNAVGRLPIPKRMRWGAGSASFVRPVHWLVLLFGDEVIDAELLGVRSGRLTRGHRFHHPEPIEVESAAGYAQQLEQAGKVIADFEARRTRILEQVKAAAEQVNAIPVIDEALLDEVTALVEWPVALVGEFDEEFLEVPPEALISSMQGHQKYFPLRDKEGRLLPRFVTIANIESRDPAAVKAGNERVIRPRLADAAFFWEQDRKQPLAARQEALKNVVYQAKLGSVMEKSERVAKLAVRIAGELDVDPAQAERAALLGKCDLETAMVGEFPELQGIMGRYYALHDGEPEAVAIALDEQYMPRFAGDRIASSPLGQVLAIAERVDTLMGIFAIGRAPSGDKDPFALRRAALGLVRTIVEGQLNLDLEWLLRLAAEGLPAALGAAEQVNAVFDFCLERLRAYYLDQGFSVELFEAVAACRPVRPLDFHRRLLACRDFIALPEASSLAAANKRIRNILRKSGETLPEAVDPALLQDSHEKSLAEAVAAARREVAPLLENRQYGEVLKRLARLRDPVDGFFDHVLVMAEDPKVRGNRLRMLSDIANLFLEVADVSRLPG